MDEILWTIDVGWTNSRPVKADEHTSRVHVMAATETDAILLACSMVCARSGSWFMPPAEMPTRTTVVAVVL